MRSIEEARAAQERFEESLARLGMPRRQRQRVAQDALRFALESWSDGFDAGSEACLESLREWANLPDIPPNVLEGLRICIANLSRAHVASAGREGINVIIRQIDRSLS